MAHQKCDKSQGFTLFHFHSTTILSMRNTAMKLAGVMLLLCALANSNLTAQSEIIDHNNDLWLTVLNKAYITDKVFITNELHVRRAEMGQSWQQFLERPAINYAPNKHVVLTAGYTFINSYVYGNQPLKITTPEHNFWEEITLQSEVGKVKFLHRYRLEHRYVGRAIADANGSFAIDSYTYQQRFRYRLTALATLKKFDNGKSIFACAFNEIWLNLKNDLMIQGFNQNWMYAGLGYQITSNMNVQLGYLDQWLRKGDNIHIEHNPTLQATFFYSFHFKKKTVV